ncbi:hypothetical protein U1Q18_052423 [Sarracenia purpurea var. burkii]
MRLCSPPLDRTTSLTVRCWSPPLQRTNDHRATRSRSLEEAPVPPALHPAPVANVPPPHPAGVVLQPQIVPTVEQPGTPQRRPARAARDKSKQPRIHKRLAKIQGYTYLCRCLKEAGSKLSERKPDHHQLTRRRKPPTFEINAIAIIVRN